MLCLADFVFYLYKGGRKAAKHHGGRNEMELRQLQYFCQLSQCLSYREAAQRLFITPQALSKSIQSLEEELNVPLFDPNPR